MKSVKQVAALVVLAIVTATVFFLVVPDAEKHLAGNQINSVPRSLPSFQPIQPASTNLLSTHPVLVQFAGWAESVLTNGTVDLALGERLAIDRRAFMLHLIKTDPALALSEAVPEKWRQQLPATVTRHFEQRVDGRGALDVRVATDFERKKAEVSREVQMGEERFAAFVYGWRRSQISQASIPIHGVAIDQHLALSADPLRVLEPEEARATGLNPAEEFCGVSGNVATSRNQPVAASTGSRVRYFCGADHYRLVSEQWLAAEGGAPGAGGKILLPDQWTQGPKSLLYIRVNFPDDLSEPLSEAAANSAMNGVNSYFTENSYNTTALITTVTPLLTLPQTKYYYSAAGPGALQRDARQLARAAGYETENYLRDIVAFTSVPGYDFGGLASVGGKGVWLQSYGVGVTAHELGHNEGLWHANSWDTSANSGVIGTATHIEYGNVYDTMGQASAGANQFNAMHKWRIDWLPEAYIHNITSNGVYRIFAFDVPSRTAGRQFAAKVKKDWQRDYWIEFRQRFPSNPWLVHGVSLNWSPWLESAGGTHLLDTTPGSPSNSEGKQDAAVAMGRTFSDQINGVHITPLLRGGAGVNSWIDVMINSGTFPSNRPPTLQIFADRTNAPTGTRINFRAEATDPDGDELAFHWTYSDQTFSTNNLPTAFKTWTTSGYRLVRCVASDMKGGSASANLVVRIGNPPADQFQMSGRITDTNGVPIEGVRVDNSEVDEDGYAGAYTDSDGFYTVVGVTNGSNFRAVKYGYTFSPDFIPFFYNEDVTNVDLMATPITWVSLTASTNVVAEANGSAGFTFTRIGDTNADLEITFFRSGSANHGADYSLLPIEPGTNFYSVIIPAGSNDVVLPLQVFNDNSSEGPETVTLTLAETIFPLSYIVNESGEATVTILDDDALAKPTVSIAASTSSGDNSAPENGYDSGRFIISRTGGVGADLTVKYSAGGSAISGLDYEPLPGVIIIPAGQSSASVEFQTIDDTLVETNETVLMSITADGAYNIDDPSATVRIIDDDLVTVTVSTTSGNAAEPSTTGRFTISRSGDLVPNLVVNYILGGAATSGVDYQPLSGTVTIPSGETTVNITVSPLNDSEVEGDESVTISLLPNAGYNVGSPGTATMFIRDNEFVNVSVTALDDEASEPGSDTASFRVSRGSITSGNLIVELAVSGAALPGYDYIPIDRFVTIPNGASFVTIPVIAFDDLHKEENELIILTVVPGENYNASATSAKVTIIDEDFFNVPAVGFAVAQVGAPESRSGVVAVSLSTTSTSPITVDYQVLAGGTATSGSDFTLPAGTLTIDPGLLAAELPLTIVNDGTAESDETIRILLSNPIGATHDGIKFHTYTILDDDVGSVTISATTPEAMEAGPTPGNFRLSRTGNTASNLSVWVEFTGLASQPSDYQPITNIVTIPAGQNFLDLQVMPVDDDTVEIDEVVIATLTSVPGGKIGASEQAMVTIIDNDTNNLPVISVVSSNDFAYEPGLDTGEYIISRAGDTNLPLTVFFALTGTATEGTDFDSLGGSVVIPAGQTSAVLTLTVIDDSVAEGEETAILALTLQDTYRVGAPGEATVTIVDNDQTVRVETSDAFAAEPGPETGAFTFTRFGTTNGNLTVFFTVSGTAGNGTDFVTITNSIVIPENETDAVLVVNPLDDYEIEPTETVVVTLTADAAYGLANPTTSTVLLYDNEPTLRLIGTATNASENGEAPGILTIERGGDPLVNVEALLSFSGTATFGVDYPPFKTNICLPPGVMSAVISINPTNELVAEGEENVFAQILPSPLYTILSPSNATVVIADASTNQFPIAQIISPTVNAIFSSASNLNVILQATAFDESVDATNLVFSWDQLSGPAPVIFGDLATNQTTVSFTNAGVYVLRVGASDGELRGFDTLTVVVDSTNVFTPDVLHWTFDEGSGTNTIDLSGRGRDGILSGPDWISGGPRDGALSFNGASNVVAESNGTNFLDGLGALSVSMWVRTPGTNAELGLFTGDTSGGTNTTLSLWQGDFSSCRGVSNLVQATLSTTGGDLHYYSARRFAGDQWQHLALVWTNGSPLLLYINGELDEAVGTTTPVIGVLTNCPQFVLGRGVSSNYWNGEVDDVRLFARALDLGEVKALLAVPPTNFVPVVEAGSNVTVQLVTPVTLTGEISDDGLPDPPAVFTNLWTFAGGASEATVNDPTNLITGVSFTNAGEFTFRLIASDSSALIYDDVLVTVTEPTAVSIDVWDFDAAEFGPDEAMIAISRFGDTTFDVAVHVAITGIASNGVDFIAITNVFMLPADTNNVVIPIRPFLDDRTEGDETVIFTIIPDLAYTIFNPSAQVVIHDSPYGVWAVERFTLEELTDPTLSGEAADFDHDGLINFLEYAFNRDPKVAELGSPMAVSIELDPQDNQNHIMLTYTRRVQPSDVQYAVYVSDDLKIWNTGPSYVEEILVTPDGTGLTEIVKARLVTTYSQTTNQFITISVWRTIQP